jgi:sorbitol-specific phosphotransferase system component IIBC
MSIGESAAAREEAEKKQKEKEKIDLLQQIATNTKIQAGLNSVGTVAGDMVAGFLSGGRK